MNLKLFLDIVFHIFNCGDKTFWICLLLFDFYLWFSIFSIEIIIKLDNVKLVIHGSD